MKTVRILILEDDLETLSVLLSKFNSLEKKLSWGSNDIAVTVLSEYTQVEEYINNTKMPFDIILLDRDCKAGGSFHTLNFDKFDVDKIISISSVPEYNENAKLKGVTRIVYKDYKDLENFANKVIDEIQEILTK